MLKLGIFGNLKVLPFQNHHLLLDLVIFNDFMAILAKKQDFLSERCRPAVRGQSGRNYKFGLKQGNIGFLASLDQKFNKIDQKESQNFLVC